MNISEIENTINDLISRHKNLDENLLVTLLSSANWEDKYIKDAIVIFKQKQNEILKNVTEKKDIPQQENKTEINGISKEEMVFYQPDGTEEKDLPDFKNEPTQRREELVVNGLKKDEVDLIKEQKKEGQKIENKEQLDNNIFSDEKKLIDESVINLKDETQNIKEDKKQEEVVSQTSRVEELMSFKKEENINSGEKSLINSTEETKVDTLKKEVPIPDDLPLIPFESSPHVWSFLRYKNVFHSQKEDDLKNKDNDEKVTLLEENKKTIENTVPIYTKNEIKEVIEESKKEDKIKKDIDVDDIELERTPMTKGDESLVVLASIMLLVIILILGYMYSNGRL